MSDSTEIIVEADLQAYVDGQLDPCRILAVEAYLAANPVEAERLAAYRAQNEALGAIYDPILDEPLPAEMRRPRRPLWPVQAVRAAAVAAVFLAGALGGWWLRGVEQGPAGPAAASVVERALLAHAVYAPEVRHPVEVAAEQEAHLVKWLTKRLGTDVRAPKLSTLGFELVGGRLLPDSPSPAAQFMYEDATGRRVTLYLRTEVEDNRETAFRWSRRGGVSVCYWIDQSVGYALTGAMDKDELWRLAELIYNQLEG